MLASKNAPSTSHEACALPPQAEGGLSDLEIEVIDLFVNAAKLLNQPRSVAEIYGILFISPEAMSLDQLMAKLQISKGSVSQGLRTLRQIGAIKLVYVPGSRCEHFSAETELRQLISGFFRGEVQQHLESGNLRLERIQHLGHEQEAGTEELRDFYKERIQRLECWYLQAQQVLPFAQKLLG